MRQIIKDCCTGKDGESYDVGRILWVFGAASATALSVYSVVIQGAAWDIQSFGIGFAAILGAGGLGIQLKAGTEPDAK